MADLPSHFGPYQIISPLGAGGMGQVYRARDTRLQRLVAIKILHDDAALDPQRQRRFAQEAVAASALNHPNILTVYDVGSEGDLQYLVSELIDGESLRAEMRRGRVPLKRAIEIVHQVAEGLAAAHEAGIVHRDLKPENVMVTADGRVKIVDFGLAKTPEINPSGGRTETETAAGLIMGTVPYMSPEQARGEAADFRSDQFALGVMLYELTTGAHPFPRDTPVQTMSAIIADEPPDLAQVMPTLPVAVRWLIRRLLSKNPRNRFAHTADLAADLRGLRDNFGEAVTSGAAEPVPQARSRWRVRAGFAGLIVAAAFVLDRTVAPADSGQPFEKYTPFATDEGYQGAPAWSPDGTQIAYEAEVEGVIQIFIRTLGSAQRTKITTTSFDCELSMWGSDGNLYFHRQAGTGKALFRVSPISGAKPDIVIESASYSAVTKDGEAIYFLRARDNGMGSLTLWVKSLPEGGERRIDRGVLGKRSGSSGFLKLSPDDSKLLLWFSADANSGAAFWEIAVPDGEPRSVFESLDRPGLPPRQFGWYADSRHVILTRSDGPTPGAHLWIGNPVEPSWWARWFRLTAPALTPLTTTPGNEGWPSVSPDGRTIAVTSEALDFDLFEVALDGSGLRPFNSSTRNDYDPAASPINTQYAFVTDRLGNPQIWLQNLEGYQQQRLVTEADFPGPPSQAIGALAFSPDGTKLAFQRASTTAEDRGVGSRIWIVQLPGGKPYPIRAKATFQDAPTWSPKGDWIAYLEGTSLVKAEVGGLKDPVTLLEAGRIPAFVARPQWSPDGKWILCETLEGLSLVPAEQPGEPRVIGEGTWFVYAWDADSRRIYGLRPADNGHDVMLVSLDSQTREERVISTNLGTWTQALQPVRGFSRLKNGGFLTSISRARSDIYLLEGFRLPRTWWQRLWPFTGNPDARR